MSDELTFSDPPIDLAEGRAGLLPWNYLSAAMADLLNRASGQPRIVLALPDLSREQPAHYAAIGPGTLADPQRTIDHIALLDMGLDPASPQQRCALGPTTTLKPFDPATNDPREVFDITGEPWPLMADRPLQHAVVIVDAGIAFWNQRFRGIAGPRFLGMRYLDFDLPNLGQAGGLTANDIEILCKEADLWGNAHVMQKLGTAYPNSIFGATANLDTDALWHGTAVADLAAGADAGTADAVALFGLELPRAVIADYSGEILTNMLAMILPAAIQMTAGFANVPLTIVMPLGFPAGPQDGSHPAAISISNTLAAAARQNVRVVLPAGNHLQDRCRARLTGDIAPSLVHWDLPPDDYSTNQIEAFGTAGVPVSLQIAPPGQGASSVAMPTPQSYRYALRNGERVGILMRFADTATRSRTRLALWHTGFGAAGGATPHGRWTLACDGPDVVDIWLLRDDRDPVADRSRPRKPSSLWHPAYQTRDAVGARPLTDDAKSAVRRSGTMSVLATALHPAVIAVQANESLGQGPSVQATYSGRRDNGAAVLDTALVDDGWLGKGAAVAANGGPRRMRMSGTSAAVGLYARQLMGIGAAPEL